VCSLINKLVAIAIIIGIGDFLIGYFVILIIGNKMLRNIDGKHHNEGLLFILKEHGFAAFVFSFIVLIFWFIAMPFGIIYMKKLKKKMRM